MKSTCSQSKLAGLLAIACLALAPAALAVNPPPDGDYENDSTAEGKDALFSLKFGFGSTAIGFQALYSNTVGSGNTAIGLQALLSNTTGESNTATGYSALHNNITGNYNIAAGEDALFFNKTGSYNIATGNLALFSNTIGDSNTVIGFEALYNNTTGSNNTTSGFDALYRNTIGGFNTATGNEALDHNSTGSNNVALGNQAGSHLTTGSNNIDIAAPGAKGESNTIRVGKVGVQTNAYIIGISGTTVAGGVGVIVDSEGHLGTVTSSARYKEAIKPMDQASEPLLALTPVTFRYNKDLDPKGIPQFGLVAEQVEKVNPDLVARDEQGKPYTVRYDAVNAMLLNEFLKEHRKVEDQACKLQELESTVAQLESTVAKQKDLQATVEQLKSVLEKQASQIQKVSDQVAASKTAPPMIVTNR